MDASKTSALNSPFKTILLAGFVAGTLDILAAIIILAKMNAAGVLKYISSAIVGNAAFQGGIGTILSGLLLHFLIAYIFATFYLIIYSRIGLTKIHPVLSGLLYGIVVWCIMNLVVVPLTNTPKSPFKWDRALLNMVILMIMVGLPIAIITHRYFQNKLANRYASS